MLKEQSEQHTKFPMHVQDKITFVAITWNLFGSLPPINSLVELAGSPNFKPSPDLIFFGTQECQRSLCMNFCCQAKGEWQAMLIEAFPTYQLEATETMGGLHSSVLVQKRLHEHFELQLKDKLKAGVCNLVGNKGAISIEISLLGQQFQLINCHLAAHQKQTEHRNVTITRILDSMIRKDLRSEVIFLGDLNYRIEMEENEYNLLIAGRKNAQDVVGYRSFLGREQLTNQAELKRDFLLRFEEGEIAFAPTYKIGVGKNEYSRERIPGWTDRIFHRVGKGIKRTNYSCEYNIVGSDHRPVLARYEKNIEQSALSLATENYIGVKSKNCQLI